MNAQEIADVLIKTYKRGNHIWICGNGGSSCEASHLSEELISSGFPAIALNDPNVITALANDFSYKDIFSKYIKAVGQPNDLLLCLTTSGESLNIIKAIRTAKNMGLKVIIFSTNIDLKLNTPRTQEKHLSMIHEIHEIVKAYIKKI